MKAICNAVDRAWQGATANQLQMFRGDPSTAPLAWWWNEASNPTPELDDFLLDDQGKVCGKGGCGADYYTHVMLANIERPMPPEHRRRG